MKEPVRGDWVSQIEINLKELNILETFEGLQSMTHSMFMKRIKSQIMKKALEYLLGQRNWIPESRNGWLSTTYEYKT